MIEDIYALFQKPKNPKDFDAIRIKLASPEKIREWSYGEVKKPETINYRTFKPERDGLFCAKIFGPVKDWECLCGKYKRMKHRGVICDKCGIEVIQSKVRRERMGHIELATPVAHVWLLRGVPSRIGTLLDMTIRQLEKVIYFEEYIVIDPGDTPLKGKELLTEDIYKEKLLELGSRFKAGMGADAIRELLKQLRLEELAKNLIQSIPITRSVATRAKLVKRLQLVEAFIRTENRPEWMILDIIPVLPPDLRPLVPLDGGRFATSDLNDLYRRVINLNNRLKRLMELKAPSVIIKNEKRMLQATVDALFDNSKRAKVLKAGGKRALKSLSDMIKGKEGRFRQNLLGKRVDYSGRSVIVPDPTLKLHQCGLPKGMALELFKPFVFNILEQKGYATDIKQAKRLVEMAICPHITVHIDDIINRDIVRQDQLLAMFLDLEQKGVIRIIDSKFGEDLISLLASLTEEREIENQIVKVLPTFYKIFTKCYQQGYVSVSDTVLTKTKRERLEVWDALDDVINEHPVLLNRQPTLHKFGIMAFDPVIVNGLAIRLHPLVCKAFNADFDGDQMAVHVPLSFEAQIEARVLMSPVNNILSPANGNTVITPTQDIVLGVYYMTADNPSAEWSNITFSDCDEVRCAYDTEIINEHTKIKVRIDGELIETTTGRVLFKEILPCGFPFLLINKTLKNDDIQFIIKYLFREFGKQDTVVFLNKLMPLGFEYATKSGLSICMDDIIVPQCKKSVVEDALKKEMEYQRIADDEKSDEDENEFPAKDLQGAVADLWEKATILVHSEVKKDYEKSDRASNSIYMMLDSRARGNWYQFFQIAGIKGRVESAFGEIIPHTITHNLKEGLSPLEFFASTYNMRERFIQTEKVTANSGWLMRKLIHVAQDIFVCEEDCGTSDGIPITVIAGHAPLADRIIGRTLAEPIYDPTTGIVIASENQEVDENLWKRIFEAGIDSIRIRSVLTCNSRVGCCAKCYGNDLSTQEPVETGTAVGMLAAQSMGAPLTQLTFDSRHIGERGSPAVEILRIVALLEARIPKSKNSVNIHAVLADQGIKNAHTALLSELQKIYMAHDIKINDKHFEIVIRQLTRKIRIEAEGDTLFLVGDEVDRSVFIEENERVRYEGGRPAKGKYLLLGLTKAILSTESWVAAAAFQETTRVLTEAALSGVLDELRGLNENILMGRLIPAGAGMPIYRETFIKGDFYSMYREHENAVEAGGK